MSKTIKNSVLTTRSELGEYYISEKVRAVIYPAIISSRCDKQEFAPWCQDDLDHPYLYSGQLNTPATQEIDIHFLESMFTDIPDNVKQLMDITTYLTETLDTYKLRGMSSFGSDGGSASFEYKQTGTISGIVTIYFHWSRGDEMGMVDWEEDEYHSIPGIFIHNHKYYAITNAFIDWLQTPNKPKRQEFLTKLFYQ